MIELKSAMISEEILDKNPDAQRWDTHVYMHLTISSDYREPQVHWKALKRGYVLHEMKEHHRRKGIYPLHIAFQGPKWESYMYEESMSKDMLGKQRYPAPGRDFPSSENHVSLQKRVDLEPA